MMDADSVEQRVGLLEPNAALGKLLESLLADVPPADVRGPDSPGRDRVDKTIGNPLNPPADSPITEERSNASEHALPAWAVQEFRALLFRIGRQQMALPLVCLHSVLPLPDDVHAIPGGAAWQCGVVRHRGRSMMTVDLGRLFGIDTVCDDPRYLLAIGAGRGALLCDAVEDAVPVVRDRVRWSTSNTQRDWLAGLLVERMCVLLDGDVIEREMRHE